MMLNKLSLNTIGLNRIGLNRIGKPSRGSSDRPYIDPEVLASLKAVCICYGKSNDDPDRAIVKNLVDPDNPFIISNAAYTEGSGYADKDSPYYGAFVTDGVDDLITSTKTVQEMGIRKACTVISMIHHMDVPSDASFNNIRNSTAVSGRNGVYASGTTGIYGWSKDDVSGTSTTLINNILGDKNNYTNGGGGSAQVDNMKFSVQGFISDSGVISETSQVAWYWTVIANKVLTTDQINQVIAYYNLDRCVEPTVLYDVKRQGLSNDTPDSDWYLKDFSKNGFNMSLFNFAKKGNSGVGKYEVDFTSWTKSHFTDGVNASSSKIEVTGILTTSSILITTISTPIYNVEIHTPNKSIVVYFQYDDGTGIKRISLVEGINELPSANESIFVTSDRLNSEGVTITQIPSHAGALCFDGVNDFGETNTLPIFRDYTVIADREIIDALTENADGGVALKGRTFEEGAFAFDCKDQVSSFGVSSNKLIDVKRFVSYQSKYTNNGNSISYGNVPDTSRLFIGRMGLTTRYSKFALWSLLLFPYSLSEFLIERQLKKHKLGTLYPDMVEWRPIYTSNVNDYTITKATYFNETGQHDLALGNHYPIGTKFRIYVKPSGAADEVTSIKVNGVELTYCYIDSNYGYAFNGTLSSKSPQKIDITIDEYIRYEDIVQPYPAIVTLKQDGKDITWGDKLKVGSEVLFANKINLLPDLYQLSLGGAIIYNETVVYGNSPIKVEKSMVFKNSRTYLKSNEPKCILSPSRLRIPNSSYKILGYIPDISGHGNHGKINNSAYAGMSGANGYLVDFNSWFAATGVDRTDNKVTLNSNYNLAETFVCYASPNSVVVPTFKVHITGIPNGGTLFFNRNSEIVNLVNGENTIEGFTSTTYSGFKRGEGRDLDWSNLIIQQIGEYEGAYCLDGVDDFITVPTLSSGGKQVLMKVNWQSSIGQGMLYDQRGTAFAIWNSDKYNDDETDTIPAYSARNGGNTYIDGILNKNILASQLRNITHNIVATNTMLNESSVSPTIGCRTEHDAYFTNMSLYDFMLFDEISTDEEILTLNEYVGIEGNTDDLFTENN